MYGDYGTLRLNKKSPEYFKNFLKSGKLCH